MSPGLSGHWPVQIRRPLADPVRGHSVPSSAGPCEQVRAILRRLAFNGAFTRRAPRAASRAAGARRWRPVPATGPGRSGHFPEQVRMHLMSQPCGAEQRHRNRLHVPALPPVSLQQSTVHGRLPLQYWRCRRVTCHLVASLETYVSVLCHCNHIAAKRRSQQETG